MKAETVPKPVSIVALAASAGGLKAISAILAALPADFPVPIVVVQHLSPHQPSMMAEILARRILLPVKEAADGDCLSPGHIYLAPSGKHLRVRADRTCLLSLSEKVHHVRPSADVLFLSVAECFGAQVVAAILTGGDGDGASGIKAIHDAGGVTIAQDQASSEAFSMPRSAIETGAVDHVLPLAAIAPMLISLTAAQKV